MQERKILIRAKKKITKAKPFLQRLRKTDLVHTQSLTRTASKQDTAVVEETAVGTLPLAAGRTDACTQRLALLPGSWGFRPGHPGPVEALREPGLGHREDSIAA